MKIGCCIPGCSFMPQDKEQELDAAQRLIAGAQMILDNGFDFAEGAVGMLMALDEEQLQRVAAKVKLAACNSFIPGHGTVIAGGESLREYVFEAMRRMNMLSCPMVVFGSGAARRIPEDMSREEGMARIRSFLEICQEAGEKYNVDVVIEPLNQQETNAINLVSEGIELCRSCGLSRIKVLADSYHMMKENESAQVMKEAGDMLCHVHVSEADRSYPGKTEDLRAFADVLREIGYEGGVSIECIYQNFEEEFPLATGFMKEVFR